MRYYNSRQIKIYDDYSKYPSEKLKEFVKTKKYVESVLDIIKDILIERGELTFEEKFMKKQITTKESNKQEFEEFVKKTEKKEIEKLVNTF